MSLSFDIVVDDFLCAMAMHTPANSACTGVVFDGHAFLFVDLRWRFRLLSMSGQCRLHGVSQSGQGLPRTGVVRIAASVSTVDLLIGTEEEDHHCQIKIKLEQVQVDPFNPRQADSYKLFGDVSDFFQTNNLLVKLCAGRSRHTSQDDH